MELAKKRCMPCEGGAKPLSKRQSGDFLKQLPSWEIKNTRVTREFKFKDFIAAMEFVNKVAEIAEKEGHHPDISIHYNKVRIELWTHAINGLSENDFIMAAKIGSITQTLSSPSQIPR